MPLLPAFLTHAACSASAAGSIVLKRAADEELLQIVRLVKPLLADQPGS